MGAFFRRLGRILKRLGCVLIGWNPDILLQCGEASVRQFYKLTSAVLIMMIIWGTIGFCFAQNYLNLDSVLPKAFVALVFIVIIVCIERVIILTVGKARVMGIIRILLAIVMATLGSTIFDQMIFRNDIQAELENLRLAKIESIVESKVKDTEKEINRLKLEVDSLNVEHSKKIVEFQKNPILKLTTVDTRSVESGRDSLGNVLYSKVQDIKQNTAVNPIKQEIDLIETTINNDNERLRKLNDRKLNMRTTVDEEYKNKPAGFIEELMATVNVVGQSGFTIAFYIIMFAFLMFLETFVVSIKLADTKCDYDLIVEHQLRIKELKLKAAEEAIRKDFVTQQIVPEPKKGSPSEDIPTIE